MSKWIGGAVKHKGALKAAARRDGLSTKEEANKESHSSNPKIRARGNLGKRFLGTAKHGNIRKGGSYKRHWSQKRTARKA